MAKTKSEWDHRMFRAWLLDELDKREWRQADLARAMRPDNPRGITSMISKWLRGEAQPDPRLCRDLAAALGADVDLVLELAGHRPPEPRNERERQIENIRAALRLLTPEQLSYVQATVRALTDEARRRGQSGAGSPSADQEPDARGDNRGGKRGPARRTPCVGASPWFAPLSDAWALASL